MAKTNFYIDKELLRRINFWRKKQFEKEVRMSFNLELYERILEIRNN